MNGLVVDLFAGGGASTALEAALGRRVDIALNHSAVALAVHRANHPRTQHLEADVWEANPRAVTGGRPVAVLWASPDCTHFSIAKGNVPRSGKIRSLAWAVVRWAEEVRPDVIFLENVQEFRSWGPLGDDGRPCKARLGETFAAWRWRLECLGYRVDHRVLDASAYGAPTKRRRLFLVARRDGQPICWPEPTHGPGRLPLRTAAECIDWALPCPSIFGRPKPLAAKTMWRIAQGVRRYVLEAAEPFVLKVNHGRWEDRSASLAEPLSTVAAAQRGHANVVPTMMQVGYGEREGQAARVPGLDKPLGTIVAGGQKHALVAAFLAKHFGGVVGQRVDVPASTITATDHHALVAAHVLKMRGECHSSGAAEPTATLTASGTHLAEVLTFLAQHGVGGPDVTIAGERYQIVDVGMRMLEPHELLRAQFGDFAASYDLSAATTKKAKVRLIGNSVCPAVAAALVRANLPETRSRT